MKSLAILALVFTLSGQAQTAHNGGNVTNSKQGQSPASTNPALNPLAVPKEASGKPPQDKGQAHNDSDRQETSHVVVVTLSPKRDWIDYVALFISAVLAGVTFVGVRAAWRGLPEILRQAKAAEDAAKAAMKSADSQINIERPWLLIEDLKAPRYMVVNFAPTKLTGKFHYTIRNYGKTPARESVDRPDIEPLHPNGSFTDSEDRDIKKESIFLWAYGFVRYQDVHGGYYETRICYRYNATTEELQLGGPTEYNQTT